MSKVLHRAPRWLDYDTPAFDFFRANDNSKSRVKSEERRDGPCKKIAHRGSEVFYAVGKDIRWADLAVLKETGEYGEERTGRQQQPNKHSTYKTLKTPAAFPIQQISVSPSGDFIAILTQHTCHVCLIPPKDSLHFPEKQEFRPRSHQVGPTHHVLEQPPLVSAIWHPLSPTGNGLVTVTRDACVRLWELDQKNRSTFNEPSLAIDLKKLANATSTTEDLGASKYGANKTFSIDDVEMQAAASCFGGQGYEEEDGWSGMTLWVAMTEGDVYALCPFLPSHFFAPATMLPSLTTSVVARSRILGQDRQASQLERLVTDQQSKWLKDLDEQDPTILPGETNLEVYSRPTRPSMIPRLQGPFQLSPEPDFGEITDLHVVAPKITQEDLFDEDDYDELAIQDGLSIGIICLTTNTGKIHVCLNIEGVEAEWLPPKRLRGMDYLNSSDAARSLLLFETVDMAPDDQQDDTSWPTFTASPVDRYEVFVTQPTGIYSVSFRSWINQLEDELSASTAGTEGVAFRIGVIVESANTTVQQLTADVTEPLNDMNGAISVLTDTGLGYLVLSAAQGHPIVAELDLPSVAAHAFVPDSYNANVPTPATEIRAPYQPDHAFFRGSQLAVTLEKWRRESAQGTTPGDIRGAINFSPYTLQKMTEAHRILSSETHELGLAAADLFRRCERMVNEMRAQIEKVRDLSNRVNSVTGEDEFPQQNPGEPELVRGGRMKIQSRIEARKEKTREIQDRVERLRRKVRLLGNKELSEKERLFAEEVSNLEKTLATERAEAPTEPATLLKMENSHLTTETERSEEGDSNCISARVEAVKAVYSQLVAQAQEVQKELEGEQISSRPSTSGGGGQGGDYRQRKMDEVWRLLERETALVDAVSARLESLQLAAK